MRHPPLKAGVVYVALVAAATVVITLGSCKPVDGTTRVSTAESQLVDNVEDSLDEVGTALEIDERRVRATVQTLQNADEAAVRTAITAFANDIRSELAAIPRSESRSAAVSRRPAVTQRVQNVDNTRPSVDSINVSIYTLSTGDLNCVDIVNFRVRFDEPVEITGTPQLQLTVGNTQVDLEVESWFKDWIDEDYLIWHLPFSYRPGPKDVAGNGIGLDALNLNDGTIKDRAGNDALRDFKPDDITVERHLRSNYDDDSLVAAAELPTIDGRDKACANGLYAEFLHIRNELQDLVDQPAERYAFAADDIEQLLRDIATELQATDPAEFADGVDIVLDEIDEWLSTVEGRGLPDEVYRFIRLLEVRHVDEFVRIIELSNEFVNRTMDQFDGYRRDRTLRELGRVGQQLDRLGSSGKLRSILKIATETAPDSATRELRRLGVGGTLSPVVQAVRSIVDDAANYIRRYIG